MPWISSEAFLVKGNEMPLMTTEAFTNIGHACTASHELTDRSSYLCTDSPSLAIASQRIVP